MLLLVEQVHWAQSWPWLPPMALLKDFDFSTLGDQGNDQQWFKNSSIGNYYYSPLEFYGVDMMVEFKTWWHSESQN